MFSQRLVNLRNKAYYNLLVQTLPFSGSRAGLGVPTLTGLGGPLVPATLANEKFHTCDLACSTVFRCGRKRRM